MTLQHPPELTPRIRNWPSGHVPAGRRRCESIAVSAWGFLLIRRVDGSACGSPATVVLLSFTTFVTTRMGIAC